MYIYIPLIISLLRWFACDTATFILTSFLLLQYDSLGQNIVMDRSWGYLIPTIYQILRIKIIIQGMF